MGRAEKDRSNWIRIVKHRDRVFIDGMEGDTINIGDGITLQVGKNHPEKAELYVRFRRNLGSERTQSLYNLRPDSVTQSSLGQLPTFPAG